MGQLPQGPKVYYEHCKAHIPQDIILVALGQITPYVCPGNFQIFFLPIQIAFFKINFALNRTQNLPYSDEKPIWNIGRIIFVRCTFCEKSVLKVRVYEGRGPRYLKWVMG